MKLNFDFSPWISPVSGNIAFWQSFPNLPVNYTIEGDREDKPQPSSALIDIRLDIIDLRHAIDNLEQRPYPDLNATYILQQPSANLPNAQALNQLANGIIKNNGGVIQIAIPNQDYLTSTLPSGKLWIGNSSNVATPSQIIIIDNLPTLGTASITIPNPIDPTNPITISGGKIWHGTDSQRPEESTALLSVEADIALINLRFLTGEFIMGDALVQATWPKAQFLKNLQDGMLKKTGKTLQRAVPGTDYIVNLTTSNVFVGDANNLPVSRTTILQQNLPNLSNGRVWQGDAANRPVEVQLNLAPTDATYIIKTPNANLTNAQVLSELGTGMAKIVAGGAFAIAISGQDYATAQQLEEIKTQCQQSAEQAATSAQEASASATEASASAGEATTAAGEATAAAGEASASAGAAGVSAGAAAASALAAGISAGSASSSASSASSSADDASDFASSASHSASNAAGSASSAAGSATQAQTYLNTLLNTGLTLQGDVTGNGLLNAPIATTFKPNPVFTGNQSMTIPSGSVSQRPASLMVGMLRLNMGN